MQICVYVHVHTDAHMHVRLHVHSHVSLHVHVCLRVAPVMLLNCRERDVRVPELTGIQGSPGGKPQAS